MSTTDVASSDIFEDVFATDAAYWHQRYEQASQQTLELQQRINQLEGDLHQKSVLVGELNEKIDALKYQLVWMAKQIFGQKTETTKPDNSNEEDINTETPSSDETTETPSSDETTGEPSSSDDPTKPNKRGKKKGAKGYGRRLRLNLPFEEFDHDLADDDKICQRCNLPFDPHSFIEDSEQIHWEVKIIRHIHHRRCYKPTCTCGTVPGIVTAPPVAKLIPKGMFTEGFWVQLILAKFLFQSPLYRIRQMLALEGFDVSQGTLTGGLKKIKALVEPLYDQIIPRSRAAKHWQMDETRWLVFEEIAGKIGYRWWLWVVVTKDTVVYLLDPSRSSKVPKEHLGNAQGILSVDRYSAYKALHDLIRRAYCWAHQRRDFIRVRDGHYHSEDWAKDWIKRINKLFHINAQRRKALDDPDTFKIHQQTLEKAIKNMAGTWQQQLSDENLKIWEKAALESMKNHWSGLTIFVDHPEVPMDNNESERRLRNPIIGRKNYYGSGSVWSGALSAMLFTILQTCCMNRIDPKQLLLAYFQACAENGGQAPQDIECFLPWNLPQQNRHAWQLNDAFP